MQKISAPIHSALLMEWARLSGGLADAQAKLRRACLVRYEDAISDPAGTIELIARTIGVPVSAFDQSVFGQVLRGTPSAPERLKQVDIEALQNAELQSIAEQFGYRSPDQLS